MNVEAMEKLAAYIEKVPEENFDMSIWGAKIQGIRDDSPFFDFYQQICLADANECKTSCCIAGYQILQDPDHCILAKHVVSLRTNEDLGRVSKVASQELGLEDLVYPLTQRYELLFYSWRWPENPETGTDFPQTPSGAAARIRYMIQTGF